MINIIIIRLNINMIMINMIRLNMFDNIIDLYIFLLIHIIFFLIITTNIFQFQYI